MADFLLFFWASGKISLAIYSTRDLLFVHVLIEQAAILEVGVSEEA
jgi:hypothetical protein